MSNVSIWTTTLVNQTLERLRMGLTTDLRCFHNMDIELKAGNLMYKLTEEEIDEFHKCSQDIVYFVEKHCRFLTDKGRMTVKLRDYQKKILNALASETWNEEFEDLIPDTRNLIMMQSRQSGKCLFSGDIEIMYPNGNVYKLPIPLFYYMLKKKLTFLEKIKVKLIKSHILLNKRHRLKRTILFLIQLIEKREYRNVDLDENDINKKILDTINVDNLKIHTPEGYSFIKEIHKTQPYTIWRIELEDGKFLEGADLHIVFDTQDNEIYIKNLRIGYYIQTQDGPSRVTRITKMPYKVSMYDVTVDNESHTYYSNGIKSHNTTTIAAYFAWYLCFHNDRNLAILANKQATAFEIVSKVTDVFKGLPFFLKPGIINAGSGGMKLDNGCMLTSQATTKTAQIGFTIHVLYADEFAHIQKHIAEDFWRSVYPTLASSDISQCVISSTPNGDDNVFYDIWDKSQKGLNSFMSIRVDWWEVPGHDEEWKEQMIADFGEENFAQEFGLDFNRAGSNLLLSGSDLKFMGKIESVYEFKELEKTDLDDLLYRNLNWHPRFDPNEHFTSEQHRFVLSIDTAEGKYEEELKESNYNICNVFQVSLKSLPQLKKLRKDEYTIKNMFRIIQVGLYRDNIKDEEVCAQVTRALAFDQFGAELCKVIIEMNFNGKYFLSKLSEHENYEDAAVLYTHHTKPIPGEKEPRKKPGFKVTGANKDFFCKLGRKMVRKRTLILNEQETIKEFKAFGKTKSGRWKGIGTHDDIAMSAVNVAHLFEEPEYEDWLYDFLDEMEDSPSKRHAHELLEKYIDTTDISDEEFRLLHQDDNHHANLLKDLYSTFNKTNYPRYTPGFTFNKNMPYSPYRKS